MFETRVNLPERKRNRLEGYDYSSAGAYFLTICTANRTCLFGRIHGRQMQANRCGEIVEQEWLRTGQMRANVVLDEYVIMPNHVHGIIVVDYPWLGVRRPEDARQSVERIVAGFKAACVRQIRELAVGADCIARGSQVWQKSFHDEIIRSAEHLWNVRRYIGENIAQWENDYENPDRNREEGMV